MNLRIIKMDPPYSEALKDILAFSTFAAAEETICRLDGLYRSYQLAGDGKGADYCRRIAALGRKRAELISRNSRVRPQKRMQKREIAQWFGIWLETPSIFKEWLAMRKRTEEFRNLLESEIHPHP